MTIALYTHSDCLDHDTGAGHPENAGRLEAILGALQNLDIAQVDAPLGSEDMILLAHTQEHLDLIKASVPKSGLQYLDGDTVMSPGSLKAALRGVGAACQAVEDIMAGQYEAAFCAIRPPGHHAERRRAMGFCLFNNIAIAALYALKQDGINRVAIVDFDVHHGNGTQDIFWQDERVFYGSTHQTPLFPGTGYESESGVGNIFNVPLHEGTGGERYRAIFKDKILKPMEEFEPDILLVSAGFDGHRDDHLASLTLREEDYGWLGRKLSDFSKIYCRGRFISFLEGGYNHKALAQSFRAYISAF